MERMLDSLLLGERVRLNFCLKQMTVIVRDAVTECSSEVQANYLGGRGIQTDKHPSSAQQNYYQN